MILIFLACHYHSFQKNKKKINNEDSNIVVTIEAAHATGGDVIDLPGQDD